MNKKILIALADCIRSFNQDAEQIGQRPFDRNQIEALASFCQDQNPNFNRDRWLSYIAGDCGSSGGKVKKDSEKMQDNLRPIGDALLNSRRA